ncbi:unnamed protein product [Urochloa humidicola]
MNQANIEDLPSDPEDTNDPYDIHTRTGTQPERGPFEDYVGQQLSCFSNEAGHALSVPYGSPDAESTLRGFLERVRRGCRRLARRMNCMASPDEAFVGAGGGSGIRAGSVGDRAATRSTSRTTTTRGGRRGGSLSIGSPRASTAARATSGSTSRGKEAAVHDSDDEPNASTDSEDDDPTYGQDIIGSSQLYDAPSPEHPTQGTPQKRRARRRDHTDIVSGNLLPTAPDRPRRRKKQYTPNPTPGGAED